MVAHSPSNHTDVALKGEEWRLWRVQLCSQASLFGLPSSDPISPAAVPVLLRRERAGCLTGSCLSEVRRLQLFVCWGVRRSRVSSRGGCWAPVNACGSAASFLTAVVLQAHKSTTDPVETRFMAHHMMAWRRAHMLRIREHYCVPEYAAGVPRVCLVRHMIHGLRAGSWAPHGLWRAPSVEQCATQPHFVRWPSW